MAWKSEFLKSAQALPPQPGAQQPAKPETDPETAQDIRTDPWAALSEAMSEQGQGSGSGERTKMRRTVPSDLPNAPYHMTTGAGPEAEVVEWEPRRWYWLMEQRHAHPPDEDWRKGAKVFGPFGSVGEAEAHLSLKGGGDYDIRRFSRGMKRDPVLAEAVAAAQEPGSSARFAPTAAGRNRALDNYCDACDRPESRCVCGPEDCDLTRPRGAATPHENRPEGTGTALSGFVTAEDSPPPRQCSHCIYMKGGACHEPNVMSDPDVPDREGRLREDGSIEVEPEECCDFQTPPKRKSNTKA